MENGETIEESDTYVRLERDGSSEMVEAGKGNMVVNGDPIETVNPELLTKKRMDEYLTALNGNENDSILLAIRISDGLRYGIMKGNDAMVHLFSGDRFVKVDMVAKAIQIWKGNGWEKISHDKGVIDLDVNGRRWEGGVRGDAPFGYGVLYDGDGRREYEGFMMESNHAMESSPIPISVESNMTAATTTTNVLAWEFSMIETVLLSITDCGRMTNPIRLNSIEQ